MSHFSGKTMWLSVLVLFLSIFGVMLLIGGTILPQKLLAFTSFVPTIEKSSGITPKEAVIITFPKPVFDTNYRQNIKITPAATVIATWESANTRLVLTPQSTWEAQTQYTLTLPQGNAPGLFAGNPENVTFTFSTVSLPKVLTISPQNGAKDVVIDIEDPITVTFDTPLEDFWVDFEFSPNVSATYQNNPEKTQFEILPQASLAPGVTYTLTMSARITGSDSTENKKIFTTTFTTLLPKPAEISKDPATHLAQAKITTQPKILEGKYIDIALATQTMVLFENGTALDSYLVSSGKRGMDTPTGTFHIQNKARKPWSKTYSLYMPYWMAITSDGKYGIHELPEWPGGYKEGANHLGTPVSHGCVRLGVGAAERVFSWADIGTTIIIH